MPPATSTAASRPPKSEWVTTDTGNKVSRRSQLHGTQHIILGGRTVICADVCIRGDLLPSRSAPQPPSSSAASKGGSSDGKAKAPLVSVSIGRYSYLSPGCTLRPPSRLIALPSSSASSSQPSTTAPKTHHAYAYHPLRIADHVYIGPHTTIEAALIEPHVVIGARCVIGKFAILKEGCRVLEGTVVPDGMVVAAGMVVGGRPARGVGACGEGWGVGEWDGGGVEGGEMGTVGGGDVGMGLGMGGDLRGVWRGVG